MIATVGKKQFFFHQKKKRLITKKKIRKGLVQHTLLFYTVKNVY